MSADRILVVDDHAGFRATARRLLERDGWLVVGEADDGASALVAVAALDPDVVLLDIGLPDASGFEIADRIADVCRARVVLLSSRDRSAYGAALDRSRAAGFIAKGDLAGTSLRDMLSSEQ